VTPYPDSATYDKLYARYLSRPVSDLLDLAGGVKGQIVWDLCAGGGRLSREALKQGAYRVVAVDSSYDMMKPLYDWKRRGGKWTKRLTIYCGPVLVGVRTATPAPNLVFCRQGVNYWFQKEAVRILASRMTEKGKFIFNTFNTRPPTKPTVKEYDYGGHSFVEVSWRISKSRMIQHVQVRDGMEMHHTQFRWITPDEFFRILTPLFAIEKVTKGRTDIYVCTKK